MLNLQKRKLAVMKDAQYAQKDSTVSTGKSSYQAVTHNQIKAILRKPMIEHGVAFHTSVKSCTTEIRKVTRGSGTSQYETQERETLVEVTVRLENVDDKKDIEKSTWHGIGVDSGDKSISKAVTNANKNALINLFLLPVGDNDETPYEGALSVAGDVDEVDSELQAQLEAQVDKSEGMDVKKWKAYLTASGMMVDGQIPAEKWPAALSTTEGMIAKKAAALKKEAQVEKAPAS